MLERLTSEFATYRLTDWAGIFGLFVTIVGFVVTVVNVMRSKRAAEQAERAVNRMRELLGQANALGDFSVAVVIMDEVKRHHRAHAWHLLPDRYSTLRRLLISIRAANPTISDKQKATLQNAIMHFTGMERKIEQVIANQVTSPNVPTLNTIVSRAR